MSSAVALSLMDNFLAAVRQSVQIEDTNLSRFGVDGAVPDAAAAPASIEQLQLVLTKAHEARLAVIPVGGASQLRVGNLPAAYDIALSLAQMDGMIAHEPADLTATVGPGVRLSDLQARLASSGQFLPLDPACGSAATIGGVLATNASGPMRHAYGTARDWLIGIRVVHADGTSSKSGGRVVKNVAGYDMHKLHIGALGTLGVIAEATFKLAPLPVAQTSIAIACDGPQAAARIVLDAHDAGLSLQAAEALSPTAAQRLLGDSRWHVIARVAGGRQAIERTLRELARLARDAGAEMETVADSDVWAQWSREFTPEGLSLRISVMPAAVAATVDALDRSLAGAATRISATVTAGVVRVQLDPPPDGRSAALVERIRDIARRNDGAMVIDAAPVSLKRELDVFGPLRADFQIMKRLKEQFDPEGVLAPGRFVGRL